MISAKKCQENALKLSEEGFEICVIGRPGRLKAERARAKAPLRMNIKLPAGTSRKPGSAISGDALLALSKCFEDLLKQVFALAAAADRGQVTRRDVEEAWAEVKGKK